MLDINDMIFMTVCNFIVAAMLFIYTRFVAEDARKADDKLYDSIFDLKKRVAVLDLSRKELEKYKDRVRVLERGQKMIENNIEVIKGNVTRYELCTDSKFKYWEGKINEIGKQIRRLPNNGRTSQRIKNIRSNKSR